jgi:hypothetical protein
MRVALTVAVVAAWAIPSIADARPRRPPAVDRPCTQQEIEEWREEVGLNPGFGSCEFSIQRDINEGDPPEDRWFFQCTADGGLRCCKTNFGVPSCDEIARELPPQTVEPFVAPELADPGSPEPQIFHRLPDIQVDPGGALEQ